MDSINENQAEANHEDLRGQEAVAKVRELAEQAATCFFCTSVGTGESSGARPMALQKVDDEGNLWFLSASDSHKNRELIADPTVNMYFQGSAHSDFLHLFGLASITKDKAQIEELWNPLFKTWFTEGKDDPRITVIKVAPTGGYYWDSKHGRAISGIKILLGAITGKTMDDSIEGTIDI